MILAFITIIIPAASMVPLVMHLMVTTTVATTLTKTSHLAPALLPKLPTLATSLPSPNGPSTRTGDLLLPL
ncbi:hypothetical protein KC366_g49 [Hortaea werneckii]|nr:hypothetical protein KC366_g49 [Hortaea werneckii]